MVGIVVVTRAALLIARRASTWTVEEHLGGQSPECCGGRPRATRPKCTAELRVPVSSEAATAAGIGNQSDRASTTR